MLISSLLKVIGLVYAAFLTFCLLQMATFWLQVPNVYYHLSAFIALAVLAIFWNYSVTRLIRKLIQHLKQQ